MRIRRYAQNFQAGIHTGGPVEQDDAHRVTHQDEEQGGRSFNPALGPRAIGGLIEDDDARGVT